MSVTASVDPLGDVSTLIGVLVGAGAATLGSFAAVSFERYVSRREAERDTALLFGDLLNTLCNYLDLLRAAHGRGDPFGPITMRMLRSVRREVEIYDRNRERLPFVRDAMLRLKIASLMGQLTFALDRVLESSEELAGEMSPERREELSEARDQGFGFLSQSADQLPAVVGKLATLARVTFGNYDAVEGAGPLAEAARQRHQLNT